MIRSVFISIVIVFSIALFTSCEKVKGKGEVVTETRTTGSYNSVSLAMSADIYFTESQGDYSLKLTGQQNILDEILTQVEGKSLVVKVRNGITLGSHEPVKVYISAPDVTGFTISGSGNTYVDGGWTGQSLGVTISGSGNISIDSLQAGVFVANISGSGNIKALAGTATSQNLTISGSGEIDLRNVTGKDVYTTTSGSGTMYVWATDLLDVTISGSGDVWYNGTPTINTHISGSGNLRKL